MDPKDLVREKAKVREQIKAWRSLPSPTHRRMLRESGRLSQADIGAVLGVHRETVSRWERGERTPRGQLLIDYVGLLDELRSESA